jgi:hypothetical protein
MSDDDFKPEDSLHRLPINPTLKTWASPRQKQIIDTVNECGSKVETARRLEVSDRFIHQQLKMVRIQAAASLNVTIAELDEVIEGISAKAAMSGNAPDFDMKRRVPSPFRVKGITTRYNSSGNIGDQWVKTELDKAQEGKAIEQWVNWLTKRSTGKSPIIKAPKNADSDIMCVYPVGDPHFGMKAWAKEAGEEFDLNKAELFATAAVDRLVSSAPMSDLGVLIILGDMLHADNEENKTDRSGASLDVSARWGEVMQVAQRALIWSIDRMLEKHKLVVVRLVRGNHDKRSSYAIALVLAAYYRNNPRVRISLSPSAFWYLQFGKVLIGATHGDTTKIDRLPGIMAQDCRSLWSHVDHCYFYQGHLHHDRVLEDNGVKCEVFRTLAPRDAWHANSGYRAGRDMRCIVHHKEYGEVERHRCDIGMIKQTRPQLLELFERPAETKIKSRDDDMIFTL